MKREDFYLQRKVLFEIVKQLKFRETVFIQKIPTEQYNNLTIRLINAWNIEMLLKNINRFDFLKLPMNMYYSLAKFNFVPIASFNFIKRKEDYSVWSKEWVNHFAGLDFAFDIDNKNLDKAWGDAKKIKEFFDLKRVPYVLSFSGSKGFHIEIPQSNISGINGMKEWVLAYQSLVSVIKKKLRVRSLDVSIADAKRIFKVKYSWDVNSGLVCLPLDDKQFYNFDVSIVDPDSVLKLSDLGMRGLLMRNSECVIDFYDFIGSL